MCTDLIPLDRQSSAGSLRKLCTEHPIRCTLEAFYPVTVANLEQLELTLPEGIEGPPVDALNTSSPPYYVPGQSAQAVLNAFRANATHLVEERFYFDVDYRSEFGITLPKQFRRRQLEVARLHFFRQEVGADAYSSLSEFVHDASETAYLGYTIVRPQIYGMVGRSMVGPHITSTIIKEGNVEGHSLVRTVVSEPVQVFGVPFIALGVPFMEQDGHLLRCAHVSAWICHYSAFLRGLTPRKTTARFHLAGAEAATAGRAYPSIGLTTATLNGVLRALGLPPEILTKGILVESREPTWADRSATSADAASQAAGLSQATAELANITPDQEHSAEIRYKARVKLEGAKSAYHRFWIRENLVSSICRYLNSSIPSIIARADDHHTQVVVGYVRNRERTDVPSGNPTVVSALIVSDDQRGPFTIIEVADLVDQVLLGSAEILVPLPPSIWLPGNAAERTAIAWFEEFANRALKEATCERDDCLDPGHIAVRDFLQGLQLDADKYTVRCYLVGGADFKFDLETRLSASPEAVRAICEMQLPKYIWICEVVDRDGDSHGPATVACLGVDAGVESVDGEVPADTYPLFFQIPGRTRIFDLVSESGGGPSDMGAWINSQTEPYLTGRWAHDFRLNYSIARIAYRFKAALES